MRSRGRSPQAYCTSSYSEGDRVCEEAIGFYWGEAMLQIEAQTSDLTQQDRMLASYHYSGDVNLWNDIKP